MSFKSKRKDLNAEINLTPFIDMLSSCVCFLLISAVWIQVGSLEIKQGHGTAGVDAPKESYEIKVEFLGPQKLRLELKQGKKLALDKKLEAANIDELLTTFSSEVQTWLLKHPASIAQGFVKPIESVNYASLVKTLDILRQQKVSNLGLLP